MTGPGIPQRQEAPSCPQLVPWRSDQARNAIASADCAVRHEPGKGVDLIIHHRQRGTQGINARKLRHGFLQLAAFRL
jgi:hypothetical protein